MSDEQRKDDEVEVEGHVIEVSVKDESAEEGDEVEAHVQKVSNLRME
jgi:hypothetical protein